MWPAFYEALEMPALAERAEFATNAGRVVHRIELERAIAEQCSTRPTAYWLERLRARELLAAPIRTVGQAVEDVATRQMGLFVELAGYDGVIAPSLDGLPPLQRTQPVPTLGEHTHELLTKLLGVDAARVAELAARGVVMPSK